jgi:hypothetical protein
MARSPHKQDELLRAIVEGTAHAVGEHFFGVLVREMATALRVPYAWVSECADPPGTIPSRVRTLALWVGRELAPNAEYFLTGTPCEDVLQDCESRIYQTDLQSCFPQDGWLREIGAQSYMGVPLVTASGRILGHVGLIDRVPLEDLELKLTILRIFGARAAAEIERCKAERDRERLLLELRRALEDLKTLRELIPVCAWCGRVRGEKSWDELEAYLERHTRISFTHGICPDCAHGLRVPGGALCDK